MMALAHVDVNDGETMGKSREKFSVDRFNPLRIPIASESNYDDDSDDNDQNESSLKWDEKNHSSFPFNFVPSLRCLPRSQWHKNIKKQKILNRQSTMKSFISFVWN